MARIPYHILEQSVDTGYDDTHSYLIDMFKLAGESRNYRHVEKQTQLGMILQKQLIVPVNVSGLVHRILAMDFERRQKTIKQKIKGKYVPEKQVYFINNTFVDYSMYYDPRKYHLSIMCQNSAIFGKAKVEIMEDFRDIFQNYFGLTDEYLINLDNATSLSRIDYKQEHRYYDEQHLSLIKFIVEIAPETIVGNNYQKQDEKDEHPDIDDFDDIEYMKKFKSESNKTVEFVIYDKQLEQEDKFRKGKITQEQLDYYTQKIRFEVRIKNRKLNSLKIDKNWALDKDIDNYKDINVAHILFSQYAELAFFKEPFHRLDYAIKLIYSSGLKPNMRKKLVKLLKAINEKGYTKAKQEYEYKSSFNTHISILRSLKINPLTFRDTWTDRKGNIHKTRYTTIPNFIQRENCVYENDKECIIPSKFNKLMEQEKVIDKS